MPSAQDAHYAALNQRVSGLEDGMRGIGVQIASLQKSIEERGRTPWGILISAIGVRLVLVGYGGNLALAPLSQAVNRNQQDIAALLAGVVPRGEHEERWRSLEAADTNLQRQIDSLDDALGGTWNLRDAIETINERLDRYDERLATDGRLP